MNDENIKSGRAFLPEIGLRDYFAGQALVGILGARDGFLVDVGIENAPGWAYEVADAMLAARKQQHKDG